MTAFTNKSFFSNCCKTTAVAGTSVRICDILGTVILAVSILISCLIGFLVRVG